ncbi:hypothetical protein [Sphingobium subterraneum]|uniref:Uncharacterized protein n=1 Tax=Sphingobium subterraneum TaxID=627688 RepID=A0A841IYU9_9SPHN|nr:hypothetical protein [Sphingobium subterraneum]MBB6123500.1 hypothetical protein [Sphingobium subterraneum]
MSFTPRMNRHTAFKKFMIAACLCVARPLYPTRDRRQEKPAGMRAKHLHADGLQAVVGQPLETVADGVKQIQRKNPLAS